MLTILWKLTIWWTILSIYCYNIVVKHAKAVCWLCGSIDTGTFSRLLMSPVVNITTLLHDCSQYDPQCCGKIEILLQNCQQCCQIYYMVNNIVTISWIMSVLSSGHISYQDYPWRLTDDISIYYLLQYLY